MANDSDAESVPWRVVSRPRVFGAGFALAVTLLVYPAQAGYGQCAPGRIVSEPKICGGATESKKQLLPEDGYLTSDKYTSLFFGFSIDLPVSSERHRITIPVMLEKHHALLAIGFEEENNFGILTVTAEESPSELERYDDQQGEQCDDTAGTASLMRRPIPGGVLRYGAFYANVHHRGRNYADHFWLRIKSYIIRVAVDSNDPEFLRESKQALVEADFYCARGGKLTTDGGKAVVLKGEPYEGPTVPTWRVDAAIKDKPGLAIPAGAVRDGVYRNPSLGLQYELPKRWETLETEESGDPPEEARALREYELLHACSRTLLHAVQPKSSDAAQQSQRPAIILRALDPSCLSLPMPASVEDKKVAGEIGANLELFSEFGEIKSHAMASLANRPFMVFHGTVGRRSPEDVLSRRMSEMILAAEQHKVLLLWSLMAPTASELGTMPASSIIFDDSQPIRLPPAEVPH
jgi:hypothetical protein